MHAIRRLCIPAWVLSALVFLRGPVAARLRRRLSQGCPGPHPMGVLPPGETWDRTGLQGPTKRRPSCLWLSRGLRERGFRRAPCARCAGTARRDHSVRDCVAGCATWPCPAPEAAHRRPRGTRSRCRSGPPDDDREGLENALEGRPHVAHRQRGDEFRGGRFRDRTADRPRIDPTTRVLKRMQAAGLDPSPGRWARQPFCQHSAWERVAGRFAGLGGNRLYFLRSHPIRPTVASGVWKPLPRKRIPRLPGPQTGCMGAEWRSKIAGFSSWGPAGRHLRPCRREFGHSRPSRKSFCPRHRIRRETSATFSAASASTPCRRGSPPLVRHTPTGSLPADELSLLREHLPGAPPHRISRQAEAPAGNGRCQP